MIQSKPSEKGEIITCLSRMGDVLDDVSEGGKLIISLGAVHSVVYGDKMNVMLWEHNFCIHAYLQIITAEARHILDNDTLDDAGFNIRDHLLKAWAIERRT